MRSQILILAAAFALAAGCNKGPDQGKPAGGADKAPPQSQVNTPSTPGTASGGASASQQERKEGANPVQGQVDPKDSEQRRDFQQRGDGAGPKSPESAPKSGN
jgi:hypothetical protein